MFGWYFVEGPVKNFAEAAKSDAERFGKWHRAMLRAGRLPRPFPVRGWFHVPCTH